MKRWLFNILSAVSLLLCLGTGALWVRSYWIADAVDYVTYWGEGGFDKLEVVSELGYVHLFVHQPPYTQTVNSTAPPKVQPRFREYPDPPGRRHALQYWTSGNLDPGLSGEYAGLGIRHWQILLAAAVLPAIWLIGDVKRRIRLTSGHCSTCGYDLRASKGRCPECGTPIPAGASPVGEDKAVSRPS